MAKRKVKLWRAGPGKVVGQHALYPSESNKWDNSTLTKCLRATWRPSLALKSGPDRLATRGAPANHPAHGRTCRFSAADSHANSLGPTSGSRCRRGPVEPQPNDRSTLTCGPPPQAGSPSGRLDPSSPDPPSRVRACLRRGTQPRAEFSSPATQVREPQSEQPPVAFQGKSHRRRGVPATRQGGGYVS